MGKAEKAQTKVLKNSWSKVQSHQMEGRFVSADVKPVAHKTYRKTNKPTKLRKSIVPGSVLILLAGRFKGKRVVFLKQLESGLLLVTGPYKVNGVPIRRVNQAYVIGTSTVVDISGVNVPAEINDAYFARVKSPKRGEEGFFDLQKEIPQEWLAKRQADQKAVDTQVIAAVEKTPLLKEYLKSTFSLRKADAPHRMKF